MHFPEEQLITYLRVFLPEQRVSAMLDEIAEAAIRADVDDELALFAIAHRLMDIDEPTHDLEAAVLVEEVGLATGEVARILDLQVADVEAAVRRAWAEADAGPAGTADPAVGAVAADEDDDADEADLRPSRPQVPHVSRRWVTGGLALAGLIALAIAVFSEAGRARLNAFGLDPVVAFFVVVGLIGGGSALLWAGNATRETNTPPPIGTPLPGYPLARPAAADHHRRRAATPADEQAPAAAGDGRATSAADANGGPAAP